jgi:hypothetical protein
MIKLKVDYIEFYVRNLRSTYDIGSKVKSDVTE